MLIVWNQHCFNMPEVRVGKFLCVDSGVPVIGFNVLNLYLPFFIYRRGIHGTE